MKKVNPIVLAGGNGTRLWPLSTKECPKQFIKLFSNLSLFQLTINRLKQNNYIIYEKITIICNQNNYELIVKQLEEINCFNYKIIKESVSKDTGPAIFLGCKYFLKKEPNANLLILPSDHYLPDIDNFNNTIKKGINYCENNNIVIFGINPDKPETGYGYIKKGIKYENNIFMVNKFKEKPEHKKALKYINTNNYYWNSGIYLTNVKKLYNEFLSKCPLMVEELSKNDINYDKVPSLSLDFCITEKCKDMILVESNYKWSDVGSWQGLWDISEKNNDGNYHEGEVISLNSTNNLIKCNKKVYYIGIHNVAVVENDDVLLIINKNNSQDIKKIINNI